MFSFAIVLRKLIPDSRMCTRCDTIVYSPWNARSNSLFVSVVMKESSFENVRREKNRQRNNTVLLLPLTSRFVCLSTKENLILREPFERPSSNALQIFVKRYSESAHSVSNSHRNPISTYRAMSNVLPANWFRILNFHAAWPLNFFEYKTSKCLIFVFHRVPCNCILTQRSFNLF